MKKESAVQLLEDVAESYPMAEWLDDETLQTFSYESKGVSYRTTIELIDDPDGVIAISVISFPLPILNHPKFDKGMKKFLKLMSKQPSFDVRFMSPHLMVMGGLSKEGTTVEQVRSLAETAFGVANSGFSGMLQFIDG